MGTENSPRSGDPARLFSSRIVPVLLGLGFVIAGVLYLFLITPEVAFGISVILFGMTLFSAYR